MTVQLQLRLLGPMQASLAAPEPLKFQRKKAAALLAVLAMPVGLERSRDELCGLLWGRTADAQARESLRQTLFVLRKAMPDGDGPVSKGDALALDAGAVWTDVADFEAAAGDGSLAACERAYELYAGEFMQGFGLREDAFERWLAGERARLKDMALSVMARLLGHYAANSRHGDAIQLALRSLALDPLQEAVHRTLIELYMATGRTGQARRQYETCRELLARELGTEPSDETRQACEPKQPTGADAADTTLPTADHRLANQQVRYCTAADGVRIAYATAGAGPPLVKAPNWMTHLEYEWESPVWRHFLHEFTRDRTLVRFDQRGNGLSDWDVADISFEAFVSDLEAVVDALELDRFPLLGISQGCAISVAYAVRNPGRVSKLVLYGGFILGTAMRSTFNAELSDALNTLIRDGWGKDNPGLRQMYTTNLIPDGTREQMDWYNELMRMSASPENAVRLRSAFSFMDITDLLPQLAVPTLVLHARNDVIAPFDESRRMAAAIPDARFVALEGNNHILLEHEPAWPRFVEEVRGSLDG